MVSDLRSAYVRALSSRLESILPDRSGYNIAEVELNPQFLATAKLLVENSKMHRSDSNLFMPVIISCFTDILEKLNMDATSKQLKERDEKTLMSTYITTKLLSTIMKFSWDTTAKSVRSLRKQPSETPSFASDFGLTATSSESSLVFSTQPPELHNVDVHHTMEIMFCLMSEEVNRKALSVIRRVPHEKYKPGDYPFNQNTTLLQEDIRSLVIHVDEYIAVILRYIAAANPKDFYSFLYRKIFAWAERGEYIPNHALRKYACSLKFLYYTSEVADAYATQIYSVMPYIRSNSWKQLCLYYDSVNLKHLCLYRPDFYVSLIVPGGSTEQSFKTLFDYASSVFEDHEMAGVAPSLHSWFVVLCPSDFDELLRKPNKLKQAFNKRLKFLSSILKDAHAGANLEAFDSLINIFVLGARISDPNHSVREFSVRLLDETYANLKKMAAKCTSEAMSTQYRLLLKDFFVSAIGIDPTKYIAELAIMLSENVPKHIYTNDSDDNSTAPISPELLLCVEIIKSLSNVENCSRSFLVVMDRLRDPLRDLLFATCATLKSYDSIRSESGGVSASSLLANPSTAAPSEKETSSEKPARSVHPLVSSIKKSNLDYGIGSSAIAADRKAELVNESLDSGSSRSVERNSSEFSRNCAKSIGLSEAIMADLFEIFAAFPESYIEFLSVVPGENRVGDADGLQRDLVEHAEKMAMPIKQAIYFRSINGNSDLFEAACTLAMTFVKESYVVLRDTDVKEFTCFLFTNLVVKAIAEACTTFQLTDPNFKLCFIFLNRFLEERDKSYDHISDNRFMRGEWAYDSCISMSEAVEVILLLALCTHDVQFFGMAKVTMKWYVFEFSKLIPPNHRKDCHLVDVFRKIIDDDSVFTGFVSLHKKFRSILMEAQPTQSLYRVWALIYQRWLEEVENPKKLTDGSLVFRHYTGFLVSTSGCFLSKTSSNEQENHYEQCLALLSAFFDKAIALLKSSELVVRVVIKDALSNESHSAVFHLICAKLMNIAIQYVEREHATSEGVVFMEQMMAILTAMIGMRNNGSFVLVSLLPGVFDYLLKFMQMELAPLDHVKLKLRFSKLCSAVETEKEKSGISGAYKVRSQFARISLEWLEDAIFHDSASDDSEGLSGKNSELEYLYIELASECLKCLELQLQNSILEVPENVNEKNLKQSKHLVFSHHFSLFFKILKHYTSSTPPSSMHKSKYKIQGIIDNVLKSVSNILQSDTEDGLQFVLPLGYHENQKIRSIFLNIFSDILSTRKLRSSKEEFPDALVHQLAEAYDVYGAAAEVASPAEHNLLATSLHGLFAYTRMLDKLFVTLLADEIGSVARSSDIFRRNSTLTRLMSIFAKEDGLPYLSVVLRPVIEEIVLSSVELEVEKCDDGRDGDQFVYYLLRLVNGICDSAKYFPESFTFICSKIYECVQASFSDAALIAVGSFVFLRFFCPAIVSPESFFDLLPGNPKVKRSLMQLVKVIQYMANGTLSSLKWPGLASKTDELQNLNKKVFDFLHLMSMTKTTEYPFTTHTAKPYTSLRYIHKFFHTYFIYIKHQYTLGDPLVNADNLDERIRMWRKVDTVMRELGRPKPISLQGTTSYRSIDNLGNSQYAEFMAKMSAKNMELAVESQIIKSAVFPDGTPAIVINFRYLKDIGYDISTFVYLVLEASNQVWDNKFYIVNDFTQFFYMGIIGKNYVSLMRNYAPVTFFRNCVQTYYFNLPRERYLRYLRDMVEVRLAAQLQPRYFFYSQVDDPQTINSLCLDDAVASINKDTRVVFKECRVFDDELHTFVPATIKLGRKWMQICFQRVPTEMSCCVTDSVAPVEVHLLTDITKCEVSNEHGENNEFTLTLNRYNYAVVVTSPQRQAILRFLYFAMLRNSKEVVDAAVPADQEEDGQRELVWFGKLFNIAFHGLLERGQEVRAAAATLIASLLAYYDFDVGIAIPHAARIAFPLDTTEFVNDTSSYLARKFPKNTYKFMQAFFSDFERISDDTYVSNIMYMSPWIDNIGDEVFMDPDHGSEKAAEIVRQFCRITAQSMGMLPFLSEYVWKKLFGDLRLTSVLLDEIIAFAIDNKSEGTEWEQIISVISPSTELCGQLISRIVVCIHKAQSADSVIASQSKLLEIMVLIKICAAMFFNSYTFASLYLLHVFFFCSLFIDSPNLEFGPDLQRLTINTIQSFTQKPGLSEAQSTHIDKTLDYFTSQRAKMLFGFKASERVKAQDASHVFNRTTASDFLCDTLKQFMLSIGSADDRIRWTSRWSALSMEIAFSNGSQFQRRAISLVGSLSRSGISDSTGGRVLRLLVDQRYTDVDAYANACVCYAKLEEGLSADSRYLPLLVWAQMCHSTLSFPPLYQSLVCRLSNGMVKLEHDDRFVERVFCARRHLGSLVAHVEKTVGADITEQNVQLHVMVTLCQGLTVSQFRHTSVAAIKTVAYHKMRLVQNLGHCDYVYEYVLLLFLVTSESVFQGFQADVGLDKQVIQNLDRHTLPKLVVDHLTRTTDETKLVIILASYIFDLDCDSSYKLKFINFYAYLFRTSKPFAVSIFHLIKDGLQTSMVNSNSIDLVNAISIIVVEILNDRDYSQDRCAAEVDLLLNAYSLDRVKALKEFKVAVAENRCDMDKILPMQEFVHRSIHSVVEGQRLERS